MRPGSSRDLGRFTVRRPLGARDAQPGRVPGCEPHLRGHPGLCGLGVFAWSRS